MEIALRVITSIIISASTTILAGMLYPKFLKCEKRNEEKAKAEKIVQADKNVFIIMITVLITFNALGIIIVAIPNIIIEYFGLNIIVIACLWAALIVDDAITYIFATKATYDDEKITVKRLFIKPKDYYFKDIISYTESGNLKVKTSNGKFLLFNSLAGTSSLRDFISEKTEI